MRANITNAVRQVLTEASNAVHFMDLSDAERINWMIERAYQLGRNASVGAPRVRPAEATQPLNARGKRVTGRR